MPHETWVESVHAVVVLEAGVEVGEEELLVHCRSLIADYKCPSSFEFIDGPLPTTPVGKIRKNVLRDPFWADQDRQI